MLNEKHIEEGLTPIKFSATTVKQISSHKKYWYELAGEPKNNPTELLYAKN